MLCLVQDHGIAGEGWELLVCIWFYQMLKNEEPSQYLVLHFWASGARFCTPFLHLLLSLHHWNIAQGYSLHWCRLRNPGGVGTQEMNWRTSGAPMQVDSTSHFSACGSLTASCRLWFYVGCQICLVFQRTAMMWPTPTVSKKSSVTFMSLRTSSVVEVT